MKILYATSEAVPFCKTGGLADVAGSLPPALAASGAEVAVVLPLFPAAEGLRSSSGRARGIEHDTEGAGTRPRRNARSLLLSPARLF